MQAEKWLHEQAQTLGWSKATKVADRATAHGLIGVLIRGNRGAMVELNCETDFVARNDTFKRFVDHVACMCLQYTDLTDFDGDLWKVSEIFMGNVHNIWIRTGFASIPKEIAN